MGEKMNTNSRGYLSTPDPALFPHMISFQSSPTITVALGANPHCEQMCNAGAGSGLVGIKSLVTTYNAYINIDASGIFN